jgi:hypothetical protein
MLLVMLILFSGNNCTVKLSYNLGQAYFIKLIGVWIFTEMLLVEKVLCLRE